MSLVIFAALALVALLVIVLWRREREHDQSVQKLLRGFQQERSELITRIQRPDYIPPTDVPVTQPDPPRDAGELAKIGTVVPFTDKPVSSG